MSTSVLTRGGGAGPAEDAGITDAGIKGEFTESQLKTVKELWESGHSQRVIAEMLGIGYETFRYRLLHSGYVLDETRVMRVRTPKHAIDGCV